MRIQEKLIQQSLLLLILLTFAFILGSKAQKAAPILSDVTGIDPEILKQLPIKPQDPLTSLSAAVKGGLSNETRIASSKTLLFAVNKENTLLMAISKATGEVVWSNLYDATGWGGITNEIQSSPVYEPVTDRVYFVAPDQRIYALSAADGKMIWKYPIQLNDYYFTPVASPETVAVITFNNATNNTELTGYHAALDVRWRMAYNTTLKQVGDKFSRIAQFGSRAFFVQYPYSTKPNAGAQNISYLSGFNVATGKIFFNRSVGFTISSLPYYVADDEVYFGGADAISNKWFYRFNILTNAPVWQIDLQPQGTKRGNIELNFPAVTAQQVVRDDYVYVNTLYGELYAVNRLTGKTKWYLSKRNMTQAKDSAPVIIQNNIVIGSDKGCVYAVNLNLTTISYAKSTPKDVLNLIPDGNTVYYGDSSGNVSSIFIDYDTTYEPIFRQRHRYYDLGKSRFVGSNYAKFDNYSSEQIFDLLYNITAPTIGFNVIKAITNDTDGSANIMVGSSNSFIYAYSKVDSYLNYFNFRHPTNASIVATGEVNQLNQSSYVGSLDNVVYGVSFTNDKHWYLNTYGPILAAPILNKGVLYVTSSDGFVYAMDPIRSKQDNITMFYKQRIGNKTVSTPFVWKNFMFFANTDGQIYSLDLIQQEMSKPLAKMGGRVFADGSADPFGYIYFGDNIGNVAKFGRDGTLQWSTPLDGPIYGGVTVINTTVAVGTMSGTFYFLDTEGGRIVKEYNNLGSIMTAPVNFRETFYVGSLDGWMYAFNRTDNTILNANQIDKERNITSLSNTKDFAVNKTLYISTSKLVVDPRGGFFIDDKAGSVIWAMTPPGATKKYQPLDYVGTIVPQPTVDEIAQEQSFQGPPMTGLDYLNTPQVRDISIDNTYVINSVFNAQKCVECSDALGRDVAKWIMGTLYSQAGIQSQYVATKCTGEKSNGCLKGQGRRLLQQTYSVPMALTFALQDKNPGQVQQILKANANNVTASENLKNAYSASSLQVNGVEQAPKETIWSKYEKYFIVIICVGGAVIIVIFALCIQAKCRKPNQRRFKKMLKNVGPLGPVMLQGNKIHQKPLLQTDNEQDEKYTHQHSDHQQSTVQEEDLEDMEEDHSSRHRRSRPQTQQQYYENQPPNFKV